MIEYKHSIRISDFEKKLLEDFRRTIEKGFGEIVIGVHQHQLRDYKSWLREDVKQFQEAI